MGCMDATLFVQPASKFVYFEKVKIGCNSKKEIKLTVNSTPQKKTINSEKMG